MTNQTIFYMPDLSKITLNEYKEELKTGRLLPSRKPLLEDIDGKFNILMKSGYNSLFDLKKALDNKKKFDEMVKKTDLPNDYLKLLKREVGNVLPVPIKFSEIPNISEKIIKKLADLDITNTEILFPYIVDSQSRKEFSKKSGLNDDEVLWLTKIVDISRIKWVGPKLAKLIVDTKFDTVEKLASAKPTEALAAFNEAKQTNKAYDGALGINDINSWIPQVVCKTPIIIKY